MSDATKLTPAERLAYRASIVRKSIDSMTPRPMCPAVSEELGHALGPLLVEYWRLLVEQWLTARNTPQQLSMTIIQVKDALQTAWAQENSGCQFGTTVTTAAESSGSPTNTGKP